MSRPPNDEANDVRAFLERMAGEAPVAATVPTRVVRRARGRLAVTAVAGFVVLLLAGYGAVAVVDVAREWNRSIPASQDRTPIPTPPTRTTAPGTYASGSAADELARYVLPVFEGPRVAGAFNEWGGETWTIDDIRGTFDIAAEDLERAGFVDAYGTAWATVDWLAGTGKDLISVVLLFESPAGARRGFELFDVEGTWQRWRWLPTRGLGEEAIAVEGRIDGYATVAYIWRVWDLVLVVASQGSLSPEVVGPLADDVQALVERAHPSS